MDWRHFTPRLLEPDMKTKCLAELYQKYNALIFFFYIHFVIESICIWIHFDTKEIDFVEVDSDS